jgi:hypothetical protein
VKLSAVLAAQLAVLSEALAEPGSDIQATLARLMLDAAAATAAFAGISVRVHVAGRATTITTLLDTVAPAQVVTSLRIPLPTGHTEPAGAAGAAGGSVSGQAQVVLYATRPGALIDLAADLSWLTGQPLSALTLDSDLADLPALLDTPSLGTERVIDQAAGVLIATGMTIQQAYTEIEHRAATTNTNQITAAQHILDQLDVATPHPDGLDG